MNTVSLYRSLCTEFFDLDKPTPPYAEYNFYEEYIKNTSGPTLEAMCGTGRYLIPFVEHGYDVHGFDASEFMLSALYAKCAAKNIKPHVWQAFLQDLNIPQRYNLIFITDSSFSLILEPRVIIQCLKKIYDHLNPGGTLIFDVETMSAQPTTTGTWLGKVHMRTDGTYIILNTLPLPVKNEIATVVCRYELIDKTNIIKTEMEYFQIRLYQIGEMEEILKTIGFRQVRSMKAHSRDARPDTEDFTIVYECVK
jgi:SAM-dependent methyltransferase